MYTKFFDLSKEVIGNEREFAGNTAEGLDLQTVVEK